MNQKGQNVVELTVLVAASMIALLLIFMIYSEQFGAVTSFNDYHTARASVRKIVDAANTVYYSGPGSEIKILVELPDSVVLEESGIDGKTVYLHMVDGSDIIDVADVNINGEWQDDSKYYMTIRYDGNVVWQIERAYEVVGGTFFVIRGGPSVFNTDFNIFNTSDKTLFFKLDLDFEEKGGMKVTLLDGDTDTHQEFTLNPGELKTIKLKINLQGFSASQLNTGLIDVNASGEDYEWMEVLYTSVEFIRE